MNKQEKLYAKDFDSKYEDFKEKIPKEKIEYFNIKLNLLPIHEQLSKLDLKNTQMEFVATSLYRSVMSDRDDVYPETKSVYTFKPQMVDVLFNDPNNQIFNQDVSDSAI